MLAMAMPLMTLQILFAPASNALGRPGMAVRTGLVGALLLPCAFLAGIQWGAEGLAWAWLGGMAVLLAATVEMSLPVIGISRARSVPGGRAGPRRLGGDGGGGRGRRRLAAGDGRRRAARHCWSRAGVARLWRACCSPSRAPIVDEVLGLIRPRENRGGRLDALDIGQHRGGLGLDLVHPELDQIADRDEPDQRLALDHRQMADPPPGHQRERAEDVGRRARP